MAIYARNVPDVEALAELALNAHLALGGATISVENEPRNMFGSNYWAVGVRRDRTRVIDKPLTYTDVIYYIVDNLDVLTEFRMCLGTWRDADGKTWLDCTRLYVDKATALAAAREAKQLCIFHLGTCAECQVEYAAENTAA